MDKQCEIILNSLTLEEYRTFLQKALGMLHFISGHYTNKSVVIKSEKSKNETIPKRDLSKDIFAYVYTRENNELVEYYFLCKSDYKRKFFHSNGSKKYNAIEHFDCLDNDNIFFLLLESQKERDYSLLQTRGFKSLGSNLDEFSFTYRFILGAGINLKNEDSSGFSMEDWDILTKHHAKIASSKLTIKTEDLEKFQSEICNTNYIIPQVAKDVDRTAYFNAIHDSLYGEISKYPDMSEYPDIEKETVYWIAEIIAAQYPLGFPQNILTFNYDDLLERVLKDCFGINSSSVFKSKKRDPSAKVSIIHSHGFLPYGKSDVKKYQDSIVLSTFEYMDAYSSSRFSAKNLYNQLHECNLVIGNSVKDYEEQKIMKNHINTYLSEYSFILLKKAKEPWMDAYRTINYMELGLLPIFFDKYSDIRDKLSSLYTWWDSIDET